MAGCVPCFIIPLILFIFHRFIQPLLLKYWNPWEKKQIKTEAPLTPSAPPANRSETEPLLENDLQKKDL